jgi:hypothetical protein
MIMVCPMQYPSYLRDRVLQDVLQVVEDDALHTGCTSSRIRQAGRLRGVAGAAILGAATVDVILGIRRG